MRKISKLCLYVRLSSSTTGLAALTSVIELELTVFDLSDEGWGRLTNILKGLPNLRQLSLESLFGGGVFADCISGLSLLTHLTIKNLEDIPHSFVALQNLECISFEHVHDMETMPQLPQSITKITMKGCCYLTNVLFLSELVNLDKVCVSFMESLAWNHIPCSIVPCMQVGAHCKKLQEADRPVFISPKVCAGCNMSLIGKICAFCSFCA